MKSCISKFKIGLIRQNFRNLMSKDILRLKLKLTQRARDNALYLINHTAKTLYQLVRSESEYLILINVSSIDPKILANLTSRINIKLTSLLKIKNVFALEGLVEDPDTRWLAKRLSAGDLWVISTTDEGAYRKVVQICLNVEKELVLSNLVVFEVKFLKEGMFFLEFNKSTSPDDLRALYGSTTLKESILLEVTAACSKQIFALPSTLNGEVVSGGGLLPVSVKT